MADQIRDWLTYLAGLNVGGLGKREVEMRLAMLAPALAYEFPPNAFNPESARYVASRCPHFPVFGEIVPLLREWQRESKLTFGMLLSDHSAYEPAPTPPERTEEELNHAARLVREVTAALRHNETERLATYRKVEELPRTRRQMTRAELTEAYRRAGVRGPVVPAEPMRAAAATMTAEVRRGPPLDDPDA